MCKTCGCSDGAQTRITHLGVARGDAPDTLESSGDVPGHAHEHRHGDAAVHNHGVHSHAHGGAGSHLHPQEVVCIPVGNTHRPRPARILGNALHKVRENVLHQLAAIKQAPALVRSFFLTPSVAYITDL